MISKISRQLNCTNKSEKGFFGFLVGLILSILHGTSFILGGILSNAVYFILLGFFVIGIATLLINKKNFSFKISTISYVTLFLFLILLSFIVSLVGSWNVPFEISLYGFFYYIRGFVILLLIFFVAKLLSFRMFLKGLFEGFLLVVFLTFLSLILNYFWGIPFIKTLISEEASSRQYTGFTGLYHNPNYWAVYSIFGLISVCYEFLIRLDNGSKIFESILITFFLLISLGSVVLTGSRMGLAGAFSVICLFFWFFFSQKKKRRVIFLLLFSSIFFLTTYFFVFNSNSVEVFNLNIISLERALERTTRLFTDLEKEDRFLRLIEYFDVLNNSAIRMLLGFGLRFNLEVGPPHNTIILILIEFGAIGFSVIFVIFLFPLLNFYLVRKKFYFYDKFYLYSIVICLCIFMITNDVIETRTFWLMIGVLLMNKEFIQKKYKFKGILWEK